MNWDKKGFKQRFLKLRQQVEAVSARASNETFPVKLLDLCKRQRVSQIKFIPLPIPGCLSVDQGGFSVFVQASKAQVEQFTGIVQSGKEDRLPGRVRFTIAHELAHTFFYDLSKPRPIMESPPSTSKELDILEILCNRLANGILLPPAILLKALGVHNISTPEGLRALSDEALVTPQVLIIGLRESRVQQSNVSALAVVLQDGDFRIAASCSGTTINARFDVPIGGKLSELVKSPEFITNGGQKHTVVFRRALLNSPNSSQTVAFEARCESLSQFAPGVHFFVTVNERLD